MNKILYRKLPGAFNRTNIEEQHLLSLRSLRIINKKSITIMCFILQLVLVLFPLCSLQAYELIREYSFQAIDPAEHTCLQTFNNDIYFTWMAPDRQMMVGVKRSSGSIEQYPVSTKGTDDVNHNAPAIGISSDGYIHFLGSMHYKQGWQYFRSAKPADISSFTDYTQEKAENEGLNGWAITYPYFYRSIKGTLFLTARSRTNTVHQGFTAGSNGGYLAKWDVQTKKWITLGTTIKKWDTPYKVLLWDDAGVPIDSQTANGYRAYQPYRNKIVFSDDNRLHLTWTIGRLGAYNDASTLSHQLYAYSPDEGETWFRSDNTKIDSLPLGANNATVIHVEDPPRLKNTPHIMLDKTNNPVVIFRTGQRSYYYQFDGSGWHDRGWDRIWSPQGVVEQGGRMVLFNGRCIRYSDDNGVTWEGAGIYCGIKIGLDPFHMQYLEKEYSRDNPGIRFMAKGIEDGDTLSAIFTLMPDATPVERTRRAAVSKRLPIRNSPVTIYTLTGQRIHAGKTGDSPGPGCLLAAQKGQLVRWLLLR